MKTPEVNPDVVDEMIIMLKVFKGCIETGVFPIVDSPCHAKIIEIINKGRGKDDTQVESLRAIVDYIEEGEPDISVIKSELNEIILRRTGEYYKRI